MSDLKMCKNCAHFAQTDANQGQCYQPSALYSLFYGVANVLCCDSCEKYEQVKRHVRTIGKKTNVR